LAGGPAAGFINKIVGKKDKSGGGLGAVFKGLLPVVGQLTLGFQVLNTASKAIFDFDLIKEAGLAIGFIKTPAQEAAAALDKLNASALDAIAREGLRGGELKNFAKDINDLLPDVSKLGKGRREEAETGGEKFNQQLLTQGALASAFEVNRKGLLSTVSIQSRRVTEDDEFGSGAILNSRSIEKFGKDFADKFIKGTVENLGDRAIEKDLGINRNSAEGLSGFKGSFGKEQQNAQTRLALGFASLAGPEIREEINKAIESVDPELLTAAITKGLKSDKEIEKEFKAISSRLATGTLTKDDRKRLIKLTKEGEKLLTQEKALAAIKSSVLKIRIKTNLEVAKLLNSSKSELENTILAEKSLTTTANSRKFELTEILRITKDTKKANQEAADIFTKNLQGSSPIKAILEGNDIKNVSEGTANAIQDAITKTAAELGRGAKFPELRKSLEESLTGLGVNKSFLEDLLDAVDQEIGGRNKILTIQQAQALQQSSLNELIRIGNKDIQTKENILKRTFDLEDRSAKLRLQEKRDSVEIARARRSSRSVSGPSVEDIIFKPREDATLRSADREERRLDIFKQARDEFREIAKSQGVIGNKGILEAINSLRSGKGGTQTEDNLSRVSELINKAAETERITAKNQAEELFRKTTGILNSQKEQLDKEFGLTEKQGAIVELQSAVYNKLDGTLNSLIRFIGTGTTQSSGDIEAQISELKRNKPEKTGPVSEAFGVLPTYDKEYVDYLNKVAKLTKDLADLKEKENAAGLSGLQTTAKKIELDNKVNSAQDNLKEKAENAAKSLEKIAEIDLSKLDLFSENGLSKFLEGIETRKQFSIATAPVPAKIPVNLDKNVGGVSSADQFQQDLEANNKAIAAAAEKDRLNFGTFAADRQKIIDIEKAASAAGLVAAEKQFNINIEILGIKKKLAEETARLSVAEANGAKGLQLQLEAERKIAKAESRPQTLKEKFASKGVTDEQLSENLGDTFVRASETFVDNLSDGINEAIVKGGDLGDVLQSVAYDFFATMAKESQRLLLKKLFFGGGEGGGDSSGVGGGILGTVGKIFGFNQGGKVTGGSGSKDDVPALLMGGEYVMKKNAVNKYGANFMEAINNGKAPKQIQKFAQGGMVVQQDTEDVLSPAIQSAASLGDSFASAPITDTFASGPTSSQFPSNVIDSPIQQFANGGLVIPKEEEEEQSGEGGFFIPGTYGGTIKGKEDLLGFATQAFTSGQNDVISSASNQFGGASSISLEPESVRLTNRGRNQGTPLQRATQEAKGQAFGIVGQQLELEKQVAEQEKQRKKQIKGIITSGLIQVAGIGLSAAAKSFNTGGKAAVAAKAANLPAGEALSAGSKVGTYIQGGLFGADVVSPDGLGQSVNVGGLKNLFNAKGNIGSSFELAQYAQKNPQSQLAKSFSQKGLTGGSFGNSGIIGASKRPRFDYLGGEGEPSTLAQAQNALGRSAADVPPQIYIGQPKEGNRSLSQDGLQYKIFDGSRWVDSFKYKGKVTGDYYGTNGPRFATGGSIPDQAGVDTVPTMLSGGEFVMNSAAANKIGQGNLERMNSGISETGSSNSESDEKLVSKLDELIAVTKESSGEINITVNGSTGEEEEDSSGNTSENSNQMARKLKEEVLKIIKDEKRLGGSLRGGGL
jgi:hypothetical protein